jgi:ubiquinone/menaquinone biosynthesis C-methylase UbiE
MPDDGGTRVEFDDFARSYNHVLDHVLRRVVDSKGSYFVRLKCAELHNIIAKARLDPARLTVVDVGCGVGSFEAILSGAFHHLIGLDVSSEMLKIAVRSDSPTADSYVCSNAQAIPLPDACAEIVFTSALFHHMPAASLVPTFRELRRICKDSGYVVCFEHNPLNPVTQLVVRTTPIDRDAHLISHRALSSALEQAGFQLLEHRFILFAPEKLDRYLYRLGKWLYRIPLGGQYLVVGRKC